ncbi:hypothetical protein RintRC_1045 [Richelia intracellularis]|nr:hypothetical protein RintRC_1045 [Richelia intracellularis]
MDISNLISRVTQYITEAAMRIFKPDEDEYPSTGVQPFAGYPYNEKTTNSW